jgi:hypothetical protein
MHTAPPPLRGEAHRLSRNAPPPLRHYHTIAEAGPCRGRAKSTREIEMHARPRGNSGLVETGIEAFLSPQFMPQGNIRREVRQKAVKYPAGLPRDHRENPHGLGHTPRMHQLLPQRVQGRHTHLRRGASTPLPMPHEGMCTVVHAKPSRGMMSRGEVDAVCTLQMRRRPRQLVVTSSCMDKTAGIKHHGTTWMQMAHTMPHHVLRIMAESSPSPNGWILFPPAQYLTRSITGVMSLKLKFNCFNYHACMQAQLA